MNLLKLEDDPPVMTTNKKWGDRDLGLYYVDILTQYGCPFYIFGIER